MRFNTCPPILSLKLHVTLRLNTQCLPILQHLCICFVYRIEQTWMKLDDRFFNSCLGCKKLQRLVVLARNARVEVKALESFIQKVSN